MGIAIAVYPLRRLRPFPPFPPFQGLLCLLALLRSPKPICDLVSSRTRVIHTFVFRPSPTSLAIVRVAMDTCYAEPLGQPRGYLAYGTEAR